MLENGGLITDYWSGTNPDMGNFPERNRIIAGLCDATLVMESRLQGGSLITGKLAFKYNRDVFAFPGKSTDNNSSGCNFLIKSHQAALIEDVKDIEYQMGWEKSKKKKKVQKKLFVELSEEEQAILDIIKNEKLALDEIGLKLNKSTSQISTHLFNLEMNGLIKSLPGKMYQIN
jgi:DNA processing protein